MSRRIGVLGGAFDPIQIGHMVLASEARYKLNLDLILFVPTYKSAHQHKEIYSTFEHRYMMTKIALDDYDDYEVSDVEKRLGEVSYTVNTLKQLKKEYTDDTLLFIMGADNLLQLESWYKPDQLSSLATLAVACRAGYEFPLLESIKDVLTFNIPLIEVSATEIRERVKNGIPIRELVPREVEVYIKKTGLYIE